MPSNRSSRARHFAFPPAARVLLFARFLSCPACPVTSVAGREGSRFLAACIGRIPNVSRVGLFQDLAAAVLHAHGDRPDFKFNFVVRRFFDAAQGHNCMGAVLYPIPMVDFMYDVQQQRTEVPQFYARFLPEWQT